MKTYKEISENLAILGIFSKDQLDKHNLDYWWRKKYTQIFESNLKERNELLINLNTAKENLDQIKYEKILNCLQKKIIENNQYSKQLKNQSKRFRRNANNIYEAKIEEIKHNDKFPLRIYLNKLEKIEKDILIMHFGLDGEERLLLPEIADKLNMDTIQVAEIEYWGIKKLESYLDYWQIKIMFINLKKMFINFLTYIIHLIARYF